MSESLHLAELNFGVLKYGWDDPRSRGFVDGLDMVNGVAARSDGFIWRMTDDDMDAAQNDPAGVFDDPATAATLSVWRDFAALHHFVFNTIHKRFFDRRREWFDAIGNSNMILWHVPVGHQPTLHEGMARFRHRETYGDSDYAFGWEFLKNANRPAKDAV